MGIAKLLRKLYIGSTNLTHSYQGRDKKLVRFYKKWSRCYDFSVRLDPAFSREMKRMIRETVMPGDTTLDIGCGTGIGTVCASEIADKVVGIDFSVDMIRKLEQKICRSQTSNIQLISGRYPDSLPRSIRFDSIISSFTIVHFTPEQRKHLYMKMYDTLVDNGRLGLFSAQGEVASSFESKNEIARNLDLAGFNNIEIHDVSDIYRIVRAEKGREGSM